MKKLFFLVLLVIGCVLPQGGLRADEAYTKYLFLYFPSNSDENIYYALSDDGFNYTPFNNGQRIVAADSVSIKGGLRDPHVLRAHDGWYYMVATDMRSAEGWTSNRGMVLLKSKDLINWEHSTVNFPTKYQGTNFANVTRVWAPETIYDPVEGKYMVYYSLLTNDGTIPYDKVYYNYANDDFTDLIGEPKVLFDRNASTIDMDIVFNDADSLYHAFYKNENDGGISKVTASQLTAPAGQEGSQWSAPSGKLQQTNVAVEGAGVFKLIDGSTWVLMYDCYSNRYYQFCTSTDLTTFTFRQNTYTSGAFTPRHGTVIPVTDAEISRMNKALGNSLEDREAEVQDASIDNPIVVDYIINGEMNNGTTGWSNTTNATNHLTATNQGGDFNVPFLENWSQRSFSGKIYQTVPNIPNGVYALNIAAFVNTLGNGTQQYVYANNEKVYLTTASPTNYTIVVSVTNNTLEVGFQQTAAIANWVGIDNVRLTYYGDTTVAAVQTKIAEDKNAALTAQLLEEIALAQKLGVDVTAAQALVSKEDLTASEVDLAIQNLKVAEYNATVTNYPDNLTSLLGNWTSTNMTNNRGQHYNGSNNSTYWEQNQGWGNTSWSMSMQQTITLPAGSYVIRCAGRSASDAVVATMSAAGVSARFPTKGDAGYGIETSGQANFSSSGTYANNGNGRGWEWRYVPFDLDEPTSVTLRLAASVENAINQWVSMTSLSILRKNIEEEVEDTDTVTEDYTKYLFLYFPSNDDENIYYALSDNGFDYTPMNGGQRIIAADSVSIKGGLRDPHILRAHDGWFYVVATDMRSAEGWTSNRGMVLMKSKDLLHWEHSTVHFPTKYQGTNFANVTRVWAPETIYDPVAGKYMIYYSLLTNDGTIPYDKVYYNYVNDDFTDLIGEPTYFYDRGSATIDMDIVFNPKDSLYHAFYKNEGQGGICKVTATSLTPVPGQPDGSQWGSPSATLQQTNVAVEGAGVFKLINSNTWVLMYDCYGSGYYQFCTSPDLTNFTFKQNTYTSGAFTPRHGTVIPITDAELALFESALARPALEEEIPIARSLGVDVSAAEALLLKDTLTTAEATAAVEALKVAEYNATVTNYPDDLTSLLSTTWTSTNMTNNQGQHYDGTTTSTYWEQNQGWGWNAWNMSMQQTITLPAGSYVIRCAGRSSSENVIATMSAAGVPVRFPTKGDTGYGIETSGQANFSTSGTYANNGNGRGWEWRYLVFDLAQPTSVTLRLEASVASATHQWVSMTSLSILRKDLSSLYGDIDRNGVVNMLDVRTLVALLLANSEVDDINDVNEDDALTLADVTSLVNYILENE